jgi:hypothetical protein
MITIILLALVIAYISRVLFRYELRNSAIHITLFSIIPIISIPYKNIVKVSKVSPPVITASFRALFLSDRWLGPQVCIEKNNGWYRSIYISPKNIEDFITKAKRHIEAMTSIAT